MMYVWFKACYLLPAMSSQQQTAFFFYERDSWATQRNLLDSSRQPDTGFIWELQRSHLTTTQVHLGPPVPSKRFLLLDVAVAAAAVCINKSMSLRMANQMQELDWL